MILHPRDHDRWLDGAASEVGDLMAPFPSEDMQVWAVGRAVGNVRNQGPELATEV